MMYYSHPPPPQGWGYSNGHTSPVYPPNPQQYYPFPPYFHNPYAPHPSAPLFTVDASGWHIPQPHNVPTPQEEQSHGFWKGRLAPFPGHASKPGLFPLADAQRPTITLKNPIPPKPATNPSNQLLPPQSFMISPQTTKSSSHSSQDTLVETASPPNLKLTEFQLDKYADPYTPQYLKNIQKRPHMLIPLPPVPVFPSFHYLQSFLPQTLIENAPNSVILSSPPAPECPPLQIETYFGHWAALLSWELESVCLEKEQIVLYKMPLQVLDWDEAKFVIHVPGIRENHPRLEIGDLVHLREVDALNHTGTDRAFEGRVAAMIKREATVHFVSPTLREHIHMVRATMPSNRVLDGSYGKDESLPMPYNISFLLNATPIMSMETAAFMMGSSLTIEPANIARRWLFPDPEDLREVDGVHSLGSHIEQEKWYDHGLNAEQRLAVSSIALRQSPVPYLISGPPGTGKTRTVVEAVLQVLRIQPQACILLCAPSNPATDTLAQRLAPHLTNSQMFRLNDPSRTFAEVPQELSHYCYVEDNKYALPPWPALMKFRVVVCCCLDANILRAAHCTNNGLMVLEQNIVNALHPHRPERHEGAPHWTHLIIDEAAQGSEPELLIPISVVHTRSAPDQRAEGNTNSLPYGPQLVLCGDINQLGPIISSEKARNMELHMSLLERLFERPLYKDHPQARKMLTRVRRKSKNDLPSSFVPFANLIKNYRSHPGILMAPSTLFYNDTLEPKASNGVIKWSGMPNPNLPLVFLGHNVEEHCLDEKITWFNAWEINKIVEVVQSLMQEGASSKPPLSPKEIGVMAPWRAQVWNLRQKLREAGLAAVDVGTVEDYQGRERRIIIISCVRSSTRFVTEDNKKAMGLIFEKKRMNVAITRAKELLIVVGNGLALKQDPYWGGLLQFALRNKLYVGPELGMELDGNYVSRLETQYLNNRSGKHDEEDQGFVLAGGIAREVLSDG